jgi:hypothetical protein
MWAHVVVRSGRVVEQNQLLFELFGRSIDEELIRGISMIKDGSMIRENIPRRKGVGGIVSPQIGVKSLFFPFS